MEIEAILKKDASGDDVLTFKTDPELQVRLTNTQGVNDLKDVFVAILNILVSEEVFIILVDNPDYGNQMYKNICVEYVAELNKDIAETRTNLVSEGLTNEA